MKRPRKRRIPVRKLSSFKRQRALYANERARILVTKAGFPSGAIIYKIEGSIATGSKSGIGVLNDREKISTRTLRYKGELNMVVYLDCSCGLICKFSQMISTSDSQE